MFFKKTFLGLMISCSALMLSSCIMAAVTVGSGTKAYVNGIYSMNIEGDYKNVYKAALKAIKENKDFLLISKDIDSTAKNAELEGATKIDSTSFTVKIETLTDDVSKVTIKFGTFGDQALSSTLMDQIQANVQKKS